MTKILSAELIRMFRHKYYWICSVIFGCIPFLAIYLQMRADIRHNNPRPEPPDGVLFAGTFYLPLFIAVFVCLHIGSEYSDKTLRNKISQGYSRPVIYAAEWTVCNAAAFLTYFIYIAVSLISGYFLTEGFITSPTAMAGDLFISFAITSVYTSIIVMICICAQSKSAGAVISLIMSITVMITGASVMQKLNEPEFLTKDIIMNYNGDIEKDTQKINPAYIDGTERKIFETAADIIPSSQTMQLAEGAFYPENMKHFPMYSFIVITLCTIFGMIDFRRKDLK